LAGHLVEADYWHPRVNLGTMRVSLAAVYKIFSLFTAQ
jgi:hypothetical protein